MAYYIQSFTVGCSYVLLCRYKPSDRLRRLDQDTGWEDHDCDMSVTCVCPSVTGFELILMISSRKTTSNCLLMTSSWKLPRWPVVKSRRRILRGRTPTLDSESHSVTLFTQTTVAWPSFCGWLERVTYLPWRTCSTVYWSIQATWLGGNKQVKCRFFVMCGWGGVVFSWSVKMWQALVKSVRFCGQCITFSQCPLLTECVFLFFSVLIFAELGRSSHSFVSVKHH